jgi:hypothetical protein
LNLRPSGYEPDELPGCSTARQDPFGFGRNLLSRHLGCQAKLSITRKFPRKTRQVQPLPLHVFEQCAAASHVCRHPPPAHVNVHVAPALHSCVHLPPAQVAAHVPPAQTCEHAPSAQLHDPPHVPPAAGFVVVVVMGAAGLSTLTPPSPTFTVVPFADCTCTPPLPTSTLFAPEFT